MTEMYSLLPVPKEVLDQDLQLRALQRSISAWGFYAASRPVVEIDEYGHELDINPVRDSALAALHVSGVADKDLLVVLRKCIGKYDHQSNASCVDSDAESDMDMQANVIDVQSCQVTTRVFSPRALPCAIEVGVEYTQSFYAESMENDKHPFSFSLRWRPMAMHKRQRGKRWLEIASNGYQKVPSLGHPAFDIWRPIQNISTQQFTADAVNNIRCAFLCDDMGGEQFPLTNYQMIVFLFYAAGLDRCHDIGHHWNLSKKEELEMNDDTVVARMKADAASLEKILELSSPSTANIECLRHLFGTRVTWLAVACRQATGAPPIVVDTYYKDYNHVAEQTAWGARVLEEVGRYMRKDEEEADGYDESERMWMDLIADEVWYLAEAGNLPYLKGSSLYR
jgi:hypothetical protein